MNITGQKSASIHGRGKTGRTQGPGFWPLDEAGLEAWYKQAVGITLNGREVSLWADQSGNGNDLIQAVASNQPVNLSHDGTNYMWLPGIAGNYASAPDIVAYNITDIDARVEVALDDWSQSFPGYVGQWPVSGQFSWILISGNGDDTLQFFYSTDGTGQVGRVSTASTGFANGSKHFIRVTFDADNGASGHDVTFYTSEISIDGPWTQLGDVVTNAGVITRHNSTGILEVGSIISGTANLSAGKIYRAQVLDGINGTVVFDADFSAESDGTTSFTESSSEAATVTINSTGGLPAQIVGGSSILFDGVDNFMKAVAFTLEQPETVYILFKGVSFTANDAVFDGNAQNSGLLYQLTSEPIYQLFAGSNGPTTEDIIVGVYGVVTSLFNGTSSEIQLNNGTPVTGDAGAGDMSGFTLGARGSDLFFGNIQVKEVIILNVAADEVKRKQVIDYLIRKI